MQNTNLFLLNEQNITAQDVFEQIQNILQQYRESPVEVTIEELKAYSLVLFYGIGSVRIQCGKKSSHLFIAQAFNIILTNHPSRAVVPSLDKTWTKMRITSLDDIKQLQSLLLAIYDEACLIGADDPFGCCSHYIECSDAKKCIKPLIFARDCQYRKSLLKGRIFYGVNSTLKCTHGAVDP